MNKLFTLLLTVGITMTGFGQSQALEDFSDKYRDKDDVTHVTISGGIFRLAGAVAELADEHDPELEAFARISDDIENMEILSIDDFEDFFDEGDVEDLIDDMKSEGYEVLMTIRENKKLVRILSQQSKRSVLKNVTIITFDRYDFAAININGEMMLDDISEIMDDKD